MWTRDNLDGPAGAELESIDLVYADPPFNSNKNYEAPIGSKAAGAAFKDTWTLSDVDVAGHGEIADREPKVYAAIDNAGVVQGPGMKSYLIMMAVRLLELRWVLKATGSLYLHCDDTADAYLFQRARNVRAGTHGGSSRAIDRHATRRLRQWLCRKHKVRTGKEVRFPADRLWSDYGLTHLAPRTASFPWAKA